MTQQNDLGAIQVSGQTEMALAARLAEIASLMDRGQLTQPRQIGREIKKISAALRGAPTETDIRAALEAISATASEGKTFENNERLSGEENMYYEGLREGALHCAKIARKALAAISPAGDTGREADAWRWRTRAEDNWTFSVARLSLNDIGRTASTYEEEPLFASPLPAARIGREEIEIACAAYAKATGYYVEFHRGLSSASSDAMRKGMRAALAALPARDAGSDAVTRANCASPSSALGDSNG